MMNGGKVLLQTAMHMRQIATIPVYHALIKDEDRIDSLNREHIFSQDRTRDYYSSLDLIKIEGVDQNTSVDHTNEVDSYDCHGTVSLSATMQSNVPEPFQVIGKAPTNLNMPGGGQSSLTKHTSSHRIDLVQN